MADDVDLGCLPPISDSDDVIVDLGRLVDDDVDLGYELGHLVDDSTSVASAQAMGDMQMLMEDVDLDMDLSCLASNDDPNGIDALVPSQIAINKPSCHDGSTNKRKADLLQARCDDVEFLALVRTHDKRQLRVGDQVAFSGGHANNYDIASAIRIAMKCMGSTLNHSLRETSHELHVLAVVGASHRKYECDSISGLMKSLKHDLSPYFIVMIGWDSTPRQMEFGSLAEQVAPMARY